MDPTLHPTLQESVAEVVRLVRAMRGLSQSELAARSGLSDVYVRQIERGERDIGIGALQKLANGLDCQPGDLFPSSQLTAFDRFIAIAHREAPVPVQQAVRFLLSASEDPVRRDALLSLIASYLAPPPPRPRGRPHKIAHSGEGRPPAQTKRRRTREA